MPVNTIQYKFWTTSRSSHVVRPGSEASDIIIFGSSPKSSKPRYALCGNTPRHYSTRFKASAHLVTSLASVVVFSHNSAIQTTWKKDEFYPTLVSLCLMFEMWCSMTQSGCDGWTGDEHELSQQYATTQPEVSESVMLQQLLCRIRLLLSPLKTFHYLVTGCFSLDQFWQTLITAHMLQFVSIQSVWKHGVAVHVGHSRFWQLTNLCISEIYNRLIRQYTGKCPL